MNSRRRLAFATVLIVALILVGTLGYSTIEHWSLFDSLYMTFITLTTVGFSEVHPMNQAGELFTVVFLVFGFGTAGFALSTLFGYIFEGAMAEAVRERRMESRRKRMKQHYIICGAGDVGRIVAEEFGRLRVPFVMVDRDPARAEFSKNGSIVFVTGDANEEPVLSEARIDSARGLVAALPDDLSNVFVVLTARQMNPALQIVAKATDESTASKLRKAGANRVITPDQIAGRRLASSVLRPQVVNFLDVIVDSGADFSLRLEEYVVEEHSPLEGRTLREANIGQATGAIVLAIVDPQGRTRINPSGRANLSSTALRAGDVLIAMGNDDQLKSLEEFMGKGTRRRPALFRRNPDREQQA